MRAVGWGESCTREWEVLHDSVVDGGGLAVTLSRTRGGDLVMGVEDGSRCGAMSLSVSWDYANEEWDASQAMDVVHACMGGRDGDGRRVLVTWEERGEWEMVEE